MRSVFNWGRWEPSYWGKSCLTEGKSLRMNSTNSINLYPVTPVRFISLSNRGNNPKAREVMEGLVGRNPFGVLDRLNL